MKELRHSDLLLEIFKFMTGVTEQKASQINEIKGNDLDQDTNNSYADPSPIIENAKLELQSSLMKFRLQNDGKS